MGNTDPEKFMEWLEKINSYLPYFPPDESFHQHTKLDWDELVVDIPDFGKKLEWHVKMLVQGRRPEMFKSLQEAINYYKQLYTADKIREQFSERQAERGKA
jgi:hypothetical protein